MNDGSRRREKKNDENTTACFSRHSGVQGEKSYSKLLVDVCIIHYGHGVLVLLHLLVTIGLFFPLDSLLLEWPQNYDVACIAPVTLLDVGVG